MNKLLLPNFNRHLQSNQKTDPGIVTLNVFLGILLFAGFCLLVTVLRISYLYCLPKLQSTEQRNWSQLLQATLQDLRRNSTTSVATQPGANITPMRSANTTLAPRSSM